MTIKWVLTEPAEITDESKMTYHLLLILHLIVMIIMLTYCVLKVNAAEVIDDGSRRPLMISCHNFLLMTSTRPPLAITRLYSSYKSNTDLAMIGSRFIGVPGTRKLDHQYRDNFRLRLYTSLIRKTHKWWLFYSIWIIKIQNSAKVYNY